MVNFKNKIKEKVSSDSFSSFAMTALVIAVVIVFNVLLYAVSEMFGLYLYQPKKVDLTLSGTTDDLFKTAIEDGKKVKISFCLPEDEVKSHSTGSYVYTTAKYYEERYEGFVELDFINLVTKLSDKTGEFVNLSKYKKDMQGNETPIYKSSVIFESGDIYRVMSDTYSSAGFAQFYTLDANMNPTSYNGEEVMAAIMSWVLTKEHRTAYFTQFHGETADIAFSNLLTCAGYYVNVLDLKKESVPQDADLLVISNPTTDFEASRPVSGILAEVDRLKDYLNEGGNLYVTLDPYVKTLPILESVLKDYGIEFSLSSTQSGKTVKNIVKDSSNAITSDGFTLVGEFAKSPIAKDVEKRVRKYKDGGILLRDVSALKLTGDAKPLIVTSSTAVLEADGKTVSSEGGYTISAYGEKENDGKTSRVFVVPSIYLSVSDALVSNEYANKDFLYAVFENLFGAENMPYGCKAQLNNTNVIQSLTIGEARLYTALIMLVPVALAVFGAVVVIKRKRR